MSVTDNSIFSGNNPIKETLELLQSGVLLNEKDKSLLYVTLESLKGFEEVHSTFLGVCISCNVDCYTLNFDYEIEHPNCYAKRLPTSLKELVSESEKLGYSKEQVKTKMVELNGSLQNNTRTLEEIHIVFKTLKEQGDLYDDYNF